MSEPKRQHIIPKCYLKQFVDPHTPPGQEPYVWIFDRGSKKEKNRAPRNILTETDLYTFRAKGGTRNYSLEKSLAQIESEYASVFEQKIGQHLPLDAREHLVLCAFVAGMLQRTLKQKANIEALFDRLISATEQMEQAHGAPPKTSLELKREKENAHRSMIVQTVPEITNILVKMNLAFWLRAEVVRLLPPMRPAFSSMQSFNGSACMDRGWRRGT